MLATAKNELKYKRFAIYAVAACVILCIPVLTQTGLVSITRTNNDLIYYLADMDWLTNHTFFEKPTFTDVTPYYFVTQNMYVHYSRLGFDVLGSVLMNLTGLQGNQLFFAYCVATVVSFNMMLLFFAERVLEIRNKWWWSLAAILTGGNGIWNDPHVERKKIAVVSLYSTHAGSGFCGIFRICLLSVYHFRGDYGNQLSLLQKRNKSGSDDL